ncbi:hypothetical protein ACFLS5_02265 [Candidatus Bipolaricaulota bacterium]
MREATRLMACVAVAYLTSPKRSCHRGSEMKAITISLCITLMLFAMWPPVLGEDVDPLKAERLRTGMTIAGAGMGLAAGSAIAIGFSVDTIDTPLSNMLLLTIPVAAVGAATGALAGYWIADVVLKHQPSPLFSIVEGAGLGLVAGGLVGALAFSTNFAIGYHILEVPEGYWGEPPIPMVAMAVISGGVWGGIFGTMAGAVALPVLSLIMGF